MDLYEPFWDSHSLIISWAALPPKQSKQLKQIVTWLIQSEKVFSISPFSIRVFLQLISDNMLQTLVAYETKFEVLYIEDYNIKVCK